MHHDSFLSHLGDFARVALPILVIVLSNALRNRAPAAPPRPVPRANPPSPSPRSHPLWDRDLDGGPTG